MRAAGNEQRLRREGITRRFSIDTGAEISHASTISDGRTSRGSPFWLIPSMLISGFGVGFYLAPEHERVVMISTNDFEPIQNAVEEQLQALSLVKELRQNGWIYSRPYTNMDPEIKKDHITGGTLSKPGQLTIQPAFFMNESHDEVVCICHVGRNLSDKGFLTLIVDHAMARVAAPNTTSNKVVTANMKVEYRGTGTGFIVIRTKLVKVNGRKVYVSGTVDSIGGRRLVDATGLFLEPRSTTLT